MLELLARRWVAVALRGAAAVAFGLVALAWPGVTVKALAVVFGAYALVDGLLTLGTSLGGTDRRDRWVLGFEGLVDVVAGGIALVWPSITVSALVLVVAAWAVATGVSEVTAAVRLRRELHGEWRLGVFGAASVLVGLLLAVRPGVGIVAVAWLVGAYALAVGSVLLALAFALRSTLPERRAPDTAEREHVDAP